MEKSALIKWIYQQSHTGFAIVTVSTIYLVDYKKREKEKKVKKEKKPKIEFRVLLKSLYLDFPVADAADAFCPTTTRY